MIHAYDHIKLMLAAEFVFKSFPLHDHLMYGGQHAAIVQLKT